jgi:formylglycine-generating enzyme required for sulfatase activity
VKVDPFWMGTHEVTWDEYRLFMFSQLANETKGKDENLDAISRPTRPYVEMSFGMGLNGYPAISMTQHAANKYAQWLSAKTGQFYRLPTEAEWEYACRAGTTTAYSFGDDPSKINDYAWYGDNTNGKYEQVGKKKPNPWGLYDMHGNVAEWTLDMYGPYSGTDQANPYVRSTKTYPQVVRGGSWVDPATQLRCGARLASDASWKMQDPQLPKSIWYLTDAQFLGFRLVRPLKVPTVEEMYRYWNNGVENE